MIFDISNPSSPVLKGSYDNLKGSLNYFTNTIFSDVSVTDNYAFLTGDEDLLIFDISNPSSPILIGNYSKTILGSDYIDRWMATKVLVSGNYVYVADGHGKFSIFDISNPSSPFLKGSYDDAGCIYDFAVSADYVYIASYDGLHILKTNLEQTPLPIADFNVNTTYSYGPIFVQFTDISGNTNGWNWNFGDEATSNEQNPKHTYSKPGIYSVSLLVSNANGISYPVTKEICAGYWNLPPVCMPNLPPVADFSMNVTSGRVPLSVQFTDSSQNAAGVSWDFGDGSNSNEKNPLHNYSAAGNYIVNLTVSNANGTDSKSYTINLQPSVYAYITNYGSNNISVIDTVTNTVIATVNVGFNPLGVTVNPSGTKVYVANEDGTVSVIDTSTNTVTDSVPVGHLPYGIAINPAGTRVYVVNLGDNTVSVIDTATNTVAATVSVGDNPIGVAFTPDGLNVYVTNHDSNSVSIIDAATNTVTGTVNVGQWPIGVAVNPAGKKVYVANVYSNTVSVIDTATNTVTATVNVGESPVAVAISPDGKNVYVTNSSPISILGTVSVIDTATNNVTTKVSVGNCPYGVAVTPDRTKIYVANEDGTISVIDTATNSVTDTVPVGQWPIAFGQFLASVPTKPVLPIANFSTNVKRIITEADNGKSISLKSGEIFYLILEDNPSTGFSWELNLSNGLAVLKDESIQNSLPLLLQEYLSGCGYSDIRTIKADSVGTQQIKGVYKQHWNGGMEIPYCVNLIVDTSYPDKTIGSNGGRSTGGGGSASSEPSTNVKIKEISQVFITSKSLVEFDFPKNDTSVMYICFDSKKTIGKTTANVEMLKGKSTLVSELPSDEIYKYLNIWVGNGGFGDSNNIANAVINFKVEKSWIQDKKIDPSSIILNRYNDKKWNQLPTSLLKEDDKYLYFTAKTPGFSPFAITGKAMAKEAVTEIQSKHNTQDIEQNNGSTAAKVEQTPEQTQSPNTSGKESTKTPGFEIASGIICLLSVFLYKRR